MRLLLSPLAIPLLLLSSAVGAQTEDARYRMLRLDNNGATFIDTRSITSTFAGKYRTVWLIILAKDMPLLGLDYFQSRTRIDCAARTSRREALYVFRQGERDQIGRAEITDTPVLPESSTELALEFACNGSIAPDLTNMRLLTLSEIIELNGILLADSE